MFLLNIKLLFGVYSGVFRVTIDSILYIKCNYMFILLILVFRI